MLCHLLSVRPHFVSFVWLVPPFARLLFVFAGSFAASSGGSCVPRPGLGSFLVAVCPSSASFGGGSAGFPGFWEDPLFACPAHSTPADFCASPLTALPFCLPLLLQRRLLPFPISGLNHTACLFAVYASPSRLSRIHCARLASGWLA